MVLPPPAFRVNSDLSLFSKLHTTVSSSMGEANVSKLPVVAATPMREGKGKGEGREGQAEAGLLLFHW